MKFSTSFRRFGELLLLQLRRGRGQLRAQLAGDLLEVDAGQQVVDRLGADHGGEAVLAELVAAMHVLVLGQKLVLLQRRSGRAR